MGSLAGLLRARNHRVTGSDEGVYPPMSTLLDEMGIAYARAFDPANLRPPPGHHRGRQRRQPRKPGTRGRTRPGAPLYLRGESPARGVPRGTPRPGRGRHAREDDDRIASRLDPPVRRPRPLLPRGGHRPEFRDFLPARGIRLLRRRGGRVRHGVLRQGAEDVALPPPGRPLSRTWSSITPTSIRTPKPTGTHSPASST